MVSGTPILQVYSIGPTTVVGFGGRDVLDDVNLVHCREEMQRLIQTHQCQVLAFDLTGVRLMPSGLLGLLASLHSQGVKVHLYNPSPDVREVLSITNLDRLLAVHEVPIDRPDEP